MYKERQKIHKSPVNIKRIELEGLTIPIFKIYYIADDEDHVVVVNKKTNRLIKQNRELKNRSI